MPPATQPKRIDLALQGGGAHGAFTWGVLDRILDDPRLEIDGISGTSAGAMNAVVLADGYSRGGGPKGAKQALRTFWKRVSDAARMSPLQRTPLDRLLGRWTLDTSPGYLLFGWLSSIVSPYQLNPFDINPLRDLLKELVDFERARDCGALQLFVSATNVRTGKARVFRRHELSAEAVMASACLPQMYRAVEIDGEAYWDGGYMGNPVLFPLIDETKAHDLVIVQINPVHRDELPRSATEIMNRLNEITFNSSLVREISSILLMKQLIDEEKLERARYTEMRLHRINAEQELLKLSVSSKLNAEWEFLEHLHDVGYRCTESWLAAHFEQLGKETTLDTREMYFAEISDLNQSDRNAPLSNRKRQR
ncbi:MAG TPA: patatin-like phospholipase family protein [Noviherbaspirillum sp.]